MFDTTTNAFVYKWTHLPTMKWYVGSRWAKGCHPDDGYICSSEEVEPLIKSNPNDWVRNIIAVGEPQSMYDLESEILQTVDAKNDPRSFNKHNNDGKFNTIGIEPWNKGKKFPDSPKKTEEHNRANSLAHLGRKRTQVECDSMKVPKSELTCPQCGLVGRGGIMKRHHFNNCGKSANLGVKHKPREIVVCPHCMKSGLSGGMGRWHFDNCKEKH